jgi:hypothetical protein
VSTDNPTPKPTIDERIQAIVETLELVAAMQRDHEKQRAEADRRWDQRFDKLLTIVESHERRLTDLEGGDQH